MPTSPKQRAYANSNAKCVQLFDFTFSWWDIAVSSFLVVNNRQTGREVLMLLAGESLFTLNRNGHPECTITGCDRTGTQEIERLSRAGFRTSDDARACLLDQTANGYEPSHRLEDGQQYKIVLIPGRELSRNRTTACLHTHAAKCGYQLPRAGIAPRLRELVSDEAMSMLDFWYITVLHDPIPGRQGAPSVFGLDRHDMGRWFLAFWDRPSDVWDVNGAFAFLVAEEASQSSD